MIFFRPGSQVYRLTTTLAVTGEFPIASLHLFGSKRTMRDLISRLTETQNYRNPETGETVTCRLLTLTGKGRAKAVRLLKSALPILDWIDAGAYYNETYLQHNFPCDASHREPRFRFAEAALMLFRAGAQIRPWNTAPLQCVLGGPKLPPWANLYSSRELKNLPDDDLKKLQYTRMSGAVFSQSGGMAVYNTRDAVMKWDSTGELKALYSLCMLARINTNTSSINSTLMFGKSEDVAVRTVEAIKKTRRRDLRFDGVYPHIYFVPLCEEGIDQLRLLLLPDWNERLLSALFEPEKRSHNAGFFEFDAIVDGTYYYSFFDGDLARLIRFWNAILDLRVKCRLLCFPFQVSLAQRLLGDLVDIRTIKPKAILEAVGIKEIQEAPE